VSSRRRALALVAAALAVTAGCAETPSSEPISYPEFRVRSVLPKGWLAGTRVEVDADGLVPPPVATYTLEVDVNGRGLELPLTLDDGRLVAEVTADWLAGPAGAPEDLRTTVVAYRRIGERVSASEALPVVVGYWPRPAFAGFGSAAPIAVYPGDLVRLSASELLRPEEGDAFVVAEGLRTYVDGPGSGDQVPFEAWAPLEVGGAGGREASPIAVVPRLLGLRPGSFDGVGFVVNDDGAQEPSRSGGVEVVFDIAPPRVDGFMPARTSRGRWVRVDGRGFLPLDAEAETASVLVFDGVFTPLRGAAEVHRAADAWVVPIEEVEGNTAGWAPLRSQPNDDGGLSGLGARAGRFEGTVTLRLAAGADVVTSDALPVVLDVTAPRQQVELRVLPGFDDALEAFGLSAEREAVLARVLAVVERDYAGLNIGFAYAAPEGYAEWSVVELTGDDPNGTHLFGLDATAGKDVGNLRLDDVIGGFDPDTRARGLAAYGGIFAAELLNLSPSLSTNALASPRFDDVFAEVVPALGGAPAQPGEAEGDTARAAAIREAVRVFGNLVGSTITHEVGHTLGLAAIDGRLHNDGDNPGWIMDAGIYRPFEERAELDGAGPATFSPVNRGYLEQILPLPAPEE